MWSRRSLQPTLRTPSPPLVVGRPFLWLVRVCVSLGSRESVWVLAIALVNLGECYRELGDSGTATVAYEESLAAAREVRNPSLTALCLANLAEIAVGEDLPLARSLAHESLALRRRLTTADIRRLPRRRSLGSRSPKER